MTCELLTYNHMTPRAPILCSLSLSLSSSSSPVGRNSQEFEFYSISCSQTPDHSFTHCCGARHCRLNRCCQNCMNEIATCCEWGSVCGRVSASVSCHNLIIFFSYRTLRVRIRSPSLTRQWIIVLILYRPSETPSKLFMQFMEATPSIQMVWLYLDSYI